MSTRGYRRVGLYRKEGGSWKNFCDIHFRYHQHLQGGFQVWLGANNRSINQINRSNRKFTEKVVTALNKEQELPRQTMHTGQWGYLHRTKESGLLVWTCRFSGLMTYNGSPYDDLDAVLYGHFDTKEMQDAALTGWVPKDGESRKPVPILRRGELKWQVETRRRMSRRDVNRLRG